MFSRAQQQTLCEMIAERGSLLLRIAELEKRLFALERERDEVVIVPDRRKRKGEVRGAEN
jgi:hypothetical protein